MGTICTSGTSGALKQPKCAIKVSYRGKDLADGSFYLELSRSTVHVAADHISHWLQEDTEELFLLIPAWIYDPLFICAVEMFSMTTIAISIIMIAGFLKKKVLIRQEITWQQSSKHMVCAAYKPARWQKYEQVDVVHCSVAAVWR